MRVPLAPTYKKDISGGDENGFVDQVKAAVKSGELDENSVIYLLEDDSFALEDRWKLASSLLAVEEVRRWAFANFNSNQLFNLCQVFPLDKEALPYAVSNPNWNSMAVLALKAKKGSQPQILMTNFLIQLPDEVVKRFLVAILNCHFQCEQDPKIASRLSPNSFVRSVNKKAFFERARLLFGLDDGIPDDWVLKALGASAMPPSD